MTAPRLDDQLCFALYTASRLVIRAYRPVLEALGVTYPQYLALLVLWEADDALAEPLTVTALGERLHLDSGTLTPLLRRLEEKGLLHRARAQDDERQLHLHLTDAGRALSAQAACVPARLLDSLDEPADPAAVRQLGAMRAALQALIRRLEDAAS